MTFPDTRPYCGQCGWNPDNSGLGDLNADLVCDSCGADLTLYGFTAGSPPPPLPSPTAFFTFADGTNALSTPKTVDLDMPDGVDLYVDLSRDDWGGATEFFISNDAAQTTGFNIGQSVTSERLKHVWLGDFSRNTQDTITLVDGERHTMSGIYSRFDGIGHLFLDGVEFFSNDRTVSPAGPPGVDDLHVGGQSTQANGLIGKLYLAQVADLAGVVAARMNADDAGFLAGPVADGLTFTSNGRVWTIKGTGISYTPPS